MSTLRSLLNYGGRVHIKDIKISNYLDLACQQQAYTNNVMLTK